MLNKCTIISYVSTYPIEVRRTTGIALFLQIISEIGTIKHNFERFGQTIPWSLHTRWSVPGANQRMICDLWAHWPILPPPHLALRACNYILGAKDQCHPHIKLGHISRLDESGKSASPALYLIGRNFHRCHNCHRDSTLRTFGFVSAFCTYLHTVFFLFLSILISSPSSCRQCYLSAPTNLKTCQ